MVSANVFPRKTFPAETRVASESVTSASRVVAVSPAAKVANPVKITLAVLASPLAVVSVPKVTSPPDMVIAASVPVPIASVPPTTPRKVFAPSPERIRFTFPLNVSAKSKESDTNVEINSTGPDSILTPVINLGSNGSPPKVPKVDAPTAINSKVVF